MRILLLSLFLALPLAAQWTLDLGSVEILAADFEPVRLYAETHFLDEADTDMDDAVSLSEAQAWLQDRGRRGGLTAVDVTIRRANEEYISDPDRLTPEQRKVLDDASAAEAAREALLRRKRPRP